MTGGSSAPSWFLRAVGQRAQSCWAGAPGASTHYLAWNPQDGHKPGLLFVHGMLAQAHWWDFIAPFFTDRYRVCALDLSGMGSSAHRDTYPDDVFVEDIVAVLRHARLPSPVVVGHSFGGSRVLHAAAREPGCMRQAIVLDSQFHQASGQPPASEPVRASPVYATEAQALARFRLLPDQDCAPWLLEHLARHSIRPVPGGWTWCFDPKLRQLRGGNDQSILGTIRVPVDYVYGGASRTVSAARAAEVTRAIPVVRGPVCLPEARHHLMLDEPLGLVGILNALLATQAA